MAKGIRKIAKETLNESRGLEHKGKESWCGMQACKIRFKVKRECQKAWYLCKNAGNFVFFFFWGEGGG